jgi:hypothetical protein
MLPAKEHSNAIATIPTVELTLFMWLLISGDWLCEMPVNIP